MREGCEGLPWPSAMTQGTQDVQALFRAAVSTLSPETRHDAALCAAQVVANPCEPSVESLHIVIDVASKACIAAQVQVPSVNLGMWVPTMPAP